MVTNARRPVELTDILRYGQTVITRVATRVAGGHGAATGPHRT